MRIGYARVSTTDQRLDLQTDALTEAGCGRVFTDQMSGAKAERPGLDEALSHARDGDTLVVWRLDRLGRSLGNLITLVNDLHERGVGFVSLQDSIDTTTAQGRFFFHVTGAFAELERNLIRERVQAGLEAARARGRKGGRPRAMSPETFATAKRLYDQREMTVAQICDQLGIKRRTFYKRLREEASRSGE